MDKKEQDWLIQLTRENQIAQVLQANQYTKEFQLTLSREDAQTLMIGRKEELQRQERVEFGEGIMKKIIYEFCDSPFVYQENYVDSLLRLQEIFYLYKNESLDECTDDELLEYMKQAFDGECQGDFEYLENTALESFAREIRANSKSFIGGNEDDI